MVTRLVDSKAHQTRLEECEKKHHEGKLKQAPTASNLASSFDVHSFTQKKKPMTHPVQKTRTPPPVSPSSSPSSSHSSSSSSSSSNDKTKTREIRLALPIICEEEEEEEMTTNLRVGFYERHRKNLPKSIALLQRRPIRHLIRTLRPDQHCWFLLQLSPRGLMKNFFMLVTFPIMRWGSPLSSRGASTRNCLSVGTILLSTQRLPRSSAERKCPSS